MKTLEGVLEEFAISCYLLCKKEEWPSWNALDEQSKHVYREKSRKFFMPIVAKLFKISVEPEDVAEARKAADSMETCGLLKDWAIIMALMNQEKYETISRLFKWCHGIAPADDEEKDDPYQHGYWKASRMVYKLLWKENDDS